MGYLSRLLQKCFSFHPLPGSRALKSHRKIQGCLLELGSELLVLIGFQLESRWEDLRQLNLTFRLSGIQQKNSFPENKHPRFMKEFSFHDPYGKRKFYEKSLETADQEKLTKLIGICGMLLQTKVYLFWDNKSQRSNHD
jgi:hypothetical protein